MAFFLPAWNVKSKTRYLHIKLLRLQGEHCDTPPGDLGTNTAATGTATGTATSTTSSSSTTTTTTITTTTSTTVNASY